MPLKMRLLFGDILLIGLFCLLDLGRCNVYSYPAVVNEKSTLEYCRKSLSKNTR